MKKIFMVVATIGLFVCSLLFSFSSDSHHRIHFIRKAHAFTLRFALYAIPCPDQSGNFAYVCGPGSSDFCSGINCP